MVVVGGGGISGHPPSPPTVQGTGTQAPVSLLAESHATPPSHGEALPSHVKVALAPFTVAVALPSQPVGLSVWQLRRIRSVCGSLGNWKSVELILIFSLSFCGLSLSCTE